MKISNFEIEDRDNFNLGHRKRLRQRILHSKFGSTADYEILEAVLSFALPRINTKPLAKTLLKKYGTFGRVLATDADLLKKNKGVGDVVVEVFRIVRECSAMLSKENIATGEIIASWGALIDYCRTTMGSLRTEQFRVLYLDGKNMLIEDELQEFGTVNSTPIYPREIAKRAIILEASAVIMVHNHPSDISKPSQGDIEATQMVMKALTSIGVTLQDHIIISESDYFSFRASSLI